MLTGFVSSTILTISLSILPTPQATSPAEMKLYPEIIQERPTVVKKKSFDTIKLPERKPKVQSVSYTYNPSPSPVQQVPSTSYVSGPLNDAQITFLGTCESGMTATRNSGNGYYGAFQFSPATWRSMNTGYERADLAPLDVQKDAVQRLLTRSSITTQFPGCSRKMKAIGMI